MYEDAYKKLKAKNKVSWDGETEASSLFDHEINLAIELKLNLFFQRSQV